MFRLAVSFSETGMRDHRIFSQNCAAIVTRDGAHSLENTGIIKIARFWNEDLLVIGDSHFTKPERHKIWEEECGGAVQMSGLPAYICKGDLFQAFGEWNVPGLEIYSVPGI